MKDLNYSFRYNYKDGTTKICGGKAARPEDLCNDFDGELSFKTSERFVNSKPSTKEILSLAKKVYKNTPGLYKIEIINTKTTQIVDYIEF